MKKQILSDLTFICEECESLNHMQNVTIKKHNIFNCQQCEEESYFTKGVEYIYVLDSNYSNLLKLGFTTREPTDRLNEINIATGAIPWDVAVYYQTLSGHKLEQKLYSLLEEYRVQKKEQLDIELKKLVSILRDKFEIFPHYIRQDLNHVKNLVSDSSSETKKNMVAKPKRPILKCPKCGFENDTPFTYVRTYCKNCGKVVPRK